MKKLYVFILAGIGLIAWNIAFAGPPLTAMPAELRISFKAPASAYPGERLTDKIYLTIKNTGGLDAVSFHVKIELRDPLPAPSTCGVGYIARLKPGESISSVTAMQLPVGLPPDLEPGKYQICAIVDNTNVVAELIENNNEVCQNITIKNLILHKPLTHLPPKLHK